MTDHYAVVGNPIAHSKSPFIHRFFATQTAQDMEYRAELGDTLNFEDQVSKWFDSGLKGLNVTLPFKERALALATIRTPRAERAGAANTLRFNLVKRELEADNTDGIGLMRDLQNCFNMQLEGMRILVLGAGGATRGILGPILESQPSAVVLTNRTEERARILIQAMQSAPGSHALIMNSPKQLELHKEGFDLVINATSSSLTGDVPEIPENVWSMNTKAYDLAYAPSGQTAFLSLAQSKGVTECSDGLGMLVEQAAEAFYWWRGVVPETQSVLQAIRTVMAAQ